MGRTKFEAAREQLRWAVVKGWLTRYEIRPIPAGDAPLEGEPFTVWFNNGDRWECSTDVAIALCKGIRIGNAIAHGNVATARADR